MRLPHAVQRIGRDGAYRLGGAVLSLAVAILVFCRFSIDNLLNRDEAIYAYGGQQLAHGVPPYASVFDPKTPVATMIAGLAAAIARALGSNDIYLIRIAFFVCSVLTVLAIYLLAARLWHSALAGVVAAIVFACFQGFAHDALAGPDAKTPGVLFTVLSMWLLARRQWFLGGLTAALAFLVWQPFVFYGVVAVLVALLTPTGRQRWLALARAVAGAVIPLVAAVVYFALAGALGKFIEAAFVFPATGVAHSWSRIFDRIRHIAVVAHHYYAFSGALFAAGGVALVLIAVAHVVRGRAHLGRALLDPIVSVVVLTMIAEVLYATYDFQSYPDLFPLLAYPALGLGGLAALAHRLFRARLAGRIVTAVALVATLTLAGFSWTWFGGAPANNNGYVAERLDACAVDRLVVPGTALYSLGDPTQLVFTHRRNPDRFIYLGEGVDKWKVAHTPGGFDGWTGQILKSNPSVVLVNGYWYSPIRYRMGAWLRQSGYTSGWIGTWYVFLTTAARARAATQGVLVTPASTDTAVGLDGTEISCGKP